MTEPGVHMDPEDVEFIPVEVKAVDVRVVGVEREAIPNSGDIFSFKLTGTEPIFQLLPYDIKRSRAVIWVLPGFVTNNVQGNVYVGSKAKLGGNAAGSGGVMPSGMMLEIKSAMEVWCVPDGSHELTVTVLVERYR